MSVEEKFQIEGFILRANYPNLFSRRAESSRDEPTADLPGYRPATVEYRLAGLGEPRQLKVRGVDILILNNRDRGLGRRYLSLLIRARQGDSFAQAEANQILDRQIQENDRFCAALDLVEDQAVVPHCTEGDHPCEKVSHKGRNLLHLSRQGYPVPDYCILTTDSFQEGYPARQDHLARAIANLEQMTERRLGSEEQPLILALRYAMPSYIPGLMPTYLNAGITRQVYPALCRIYGVKPAARMYLNNLRNLRLLLADEGYTLSKDVSRSLSGMGHLSADIALLEKEIDELDEGLLQDARYQIEFLDRCSAGFFRTNRDLIFTLSHGRSVRPALILQQMICTVRGLDSYPGVLYSRNPNTGRKMMVEMVRSIFGEDIMTGTVQAEVVEFSDRAEIKADFPALHHFIPSLRVLEREFHSTVTVEFASETVRQGHFFAMLQLNESEMTGRGALVSTMDMHSEGQITGPRAPGLVKPFHLRQIMSDTIDEEAVDELEFFSEGYSILPRSAVSARLFFSTEKALAAQEGGETVCLCRQRFTPADTAAIGKVDLILSLDPAAIHLVTTCRGQGTVAFLDLASYGVRMDDEGGMVNNRGLRLVEGDWVTVSSRRKKVFKGKARFTPARFHKYRQGVKMEMLPREEEVFRILETAFNQYHELVAGLKADQVVSYADLAKLVLIDLKDDRERAAEIVNCWHGFFPEEYVSAILGSDLGTHNKQFQVFSLLEPEHQICLLREAVRRCLSQGWSGMDAGSFMLGRFIQSGHSVAFWNQLGDGEIAFLLNEWILYRKYRELMQEVGEHHIARARKILLEEPERPLRLSSVDVKNFVQLKLSSKDLDKIAAALPQNASPETRELLEWARQPFGSLYDYGAPWSLNPLKKLCQQEGIDLPGAEEA
jgi:hypothetical protein